MLRCSVTPSRVDAGNGPITGTKHVREVKLDKRCYTQFEQTNQIRTQLFGVCVWRLQELSCGESSCEALEAVAVDCAAVYIGAFCGGYQCWQLYRSAMVVQKSCERRCVLVRRIDW